MVLTEGRNREIRRMAARIGHKVMSLKRIGFGPLRLGGLPPGAYRNLTRHELQKLEELVRQNRQAADTGPRAGSRSGRREDFRPGGAARPAGSNKVSGAPRPRRPRRKTQGKRR